MNLTNLTNYDRGAIERIIDTSIKIKHDPTRYSEFLKHKKMYMLFEKTSTRTSLSFGLGFNELGGTYFIQRWVDSNFVVGDIEDETRYVARNVDIILARLKHNESIERMGEASPVPVINGCCDKYHPTQALADCMTVKELFGSYDIKLLYIGIWNNVFNSLTLTLPKLGGKLIGICPVLNEATISKDEIDTVVGSSENLEFYGGEELSSERVREIVSDVDVVYTDTWVDMEFFNNPEYASVKDERIRLMKPFALTSGLLKESRAKVMHDMPIHPGYEIERDVIEAHIETILHQAENRRHVAKGIFTYLLNREV